MYFARGRYSEPAKVEYRDEQEPFFPDTALDLCLSQNDHRFTIGDFFLGMAS